MRFLKTKKSGMYHQKALDLDLAPAEPRHIFLKRSRGIEDIVGYREDDLDTDPSSEGFENEEDFNMNNVDKCGDS